MKKFLLFLSFLLTSLSPSLSLAQQATEAVKYRVIAVSQSENKVISVSNEVTLYSSFSLTVPTAFTPNGDGLNDHFGGVQTSGVKEYKLIVYNRYGEVIFQSNTPENKWDGTFNGQIVPSGGYLYEIQARSFEQEDFQKSGKVLVII